jgi:hypothetical protein
MWREKYCININFYFDWKKNSNQETLHSIAVPFFYVNAQLIVEIRFLTVFYTSVIPVPNHVNELTV